MAAIRNDYTTLPIDLINEILLRLPVKSLLCYKSVCKQWHTMITNLSFIRQHFHHESNHTHLLLKGLEKDTLDPFFLLFTNETLERIDQRTDYPDLLEKSWILRGPCNGIFCMLHNYFKRFALWNPSTRRLRPLPYPPRKCRKDVKFDFGMDPLTNEIKIVLIYDYWSTDFAVYTSSNDSWKYYKKEALLLGDISSNICATTFLNGFCYWRTYNRKRSSFVILAFDMHNESFLEIEMSEVIKSIEFADLHLYNDSLALFTFKKYNCKEQFVIWAMKEKGSWIKLCNVVVPYKIRSLPPLGFWKSTEIFLINTDQEGVMYDPNSNKIKIITIEKNRTECISPFYYKESLVPVKNEHGIQDYDSNYFRLYTELEYYGFYSRQDSLIDTLQQSLFGKQA